MAKFLDSSEKVEKPLLNAVGRQSQKIVDELLPQIRLASLENDGACMIDLKIVKVLLISLRKEHTLKKHQVNNQSAYILVYLQTQK